MSTTNSNVQAETHIKKQNSEDLLVKCICKNVITTSSTRSTTRIPLTKCDKCVHSTISEVTSSATTTKQKRKQTEQSTRTKKHATSTNQTIRKKSRVIEQVECARCATSTKPVYRELEEWLCKICAPTRDVCMSSRNGCRYRDIAAKLHRHRQFYCTFSSECPVCKKSTKFGNLHYYTAHSDIMQVETHVWTASFDTDEHWYILSAENYDFTEQYDLTMCRTQRDTEGFNFYAYTSIPSEQLYQYRCEIEFRHPVTGQSITRTLNGVYQYDYDFHMYISHTASQLYLHDYKCHVKIEIIDNTEPT